MICGSEILGGNMIRVAIADDEEYVLKGMRDKIELVNGECVICGCAKNGLEAEKILYESRPDIFFVDINMPEIDGMTFIKRARSQFPETGTRFVIVSGYDDFAYLQEAVRLQVCDYLRKPVLQDELSGLLDKLAAELRDEKREKSILFHKYYKLWDEFKREEKEHRGTFLIMYSPGIVAALKNVPLKGLCRKIFGIDVGQYTCELILFPGIENAVGLYIEDVYADKQELNELFIELRLEVPVKCVYTFIEKGHMEQYAAAMDAGLNRRFCGDMVRMTVRCSLEKINCNIPDIELIFLYGNQEEVNRMAQKVLLELTVPEKIGELGEAYRKMIMLLINLLLKNGLPVEARFHEELIYFSLTKYQNVQELIAALSDFIDCVKAQVADRKERSELVGQVSGYLEEHFRENISLNALSDEFFVTPTYLSKRFKEKTGINLSQYIENLKIEYAKKMLSCSEESISDIAAEVGYMDSNYFSRVFKKQVGRTPSEFRIEKQTESRIP